MASQPSQGPPAGAKHPGASAGPWQARSQRQERRARQGQKQALLGAQGAPALARHFWRAPVPFLLAREKALARERLARLLKRSGCKAVLLK